ncbi:hypothetical protein [Cutibacterium avidum]|nr:hypothetical protein [Cutibacterium avidum]
MTVRQNRCGTRRRRSDHGLRRIYEILWLITLIGLDVVVIFIKLIDHE